jgi:hypothetical protein
MKDHNKKYCKILKRVIIEAKKLYFSNQIITSSSKVKIAWKIIKNNSGNSQSYAAVMLMILYYHTTRKCKCI